ncbi:MAG: amidase [Actinobacteria bacterium]|uniref:Unannotated protein n=1 Tax=freshwater metagenome TaxID=449393 RepID=A0A6J7P6I1_9ZZZZ|nr:amidase [Actinomycetota bacterium]MSX79696.1 amidase [Actinomycetota bacterium]
MSELPLHHKSLVELRNLLALKELSSRELLDHYVARIEKLNPAVNAVVTVDLESGRRAAEAADAEAAAGRHTRPLHGIPITVKDALAVRGLRSTGGAIEHGDHVPTKDADAVALVRSAGAIPFAKTNVPRWSGDIQTYNNIFGTTNNPWDHTRTPGGSSGGAATSVALGFTGFEIGTDIGGSIRFPAAFCGVAGHKPSYGLVPCGGYIDRIDYGMVEPDINVHGPLARSVDDLELLLHILAAPRPERAHTVSHRLPMPRHERIDAFRVAIWSDDDACPVSADVRAAVERAGDVLQSLGAAVNRSARPDLNADASSQLALWLVSAATAPSMSDEDFARYRAIATSPDTPPEVTAALSSFTATHRDWMAADVVRQHLREQWRVFFQQYDALICPVTMTHAFPHTQEGSLPERTVLVDGVERPYLELLWWTVLIGGVYLPATVIPVGTSADGLPIGVQIVAPYMEDRTALAVARAIRNELGPITFPT